jgi:hypothetical protein
MPDDSRHLQVWRENNYLDFVRIIRLGQGLGQDLQVTQTLIHPKSTWLGF